MSPLCQLQMTLSGGCWGGDGSADERWGACAARGAAGLDQRRLTTVAVAQLFHLAQRLCHGNERGIERGQGLIRSHAAATASNHRCRFGSEDPQRRPGDEMRLVVERIVDGGVHAEEALGGCCRLEALHLALSPSHDLV